MVYSRHDHGPAASVLITSQITFPDQTTAQTTAAALSGTASVPGMSPIFASASSLNTAMASASVSVSSIMAAPAPVAIVRSPPLPVPPLPLSSKYF